MSELLKMRDRFRKRLEAEKRGVRDVAWYPYDTLTAFDHIDSFFGGRPERVVDLARGKSVLDVGCGDGDLSFFLEDLGLPYIHALENPLPNYNSLRGVYALKQRLKSRVEIVERDIDRSFDLKESYGLAFCLGVLYHLKNPFYVLERLSQSCDACVISTRIFDAPDDAPVAWLIGGEEMNADSTNTWIFSEAALRRLLDRAGWRVVDWRRTPAGRRADAVQAAGDVRAYALVESIATDPARWGRLLHGWHELENRSWRWTERCFGIELPAPRREAAANLVLRFALHPAVPVPLTVKVRIDGAELPALSLSQTGVQEARWEVPAPSHPVKVEFEGSHAIHFGDDPRELCLNVVSCGWEYA